MNFLEEIVDVVLEKHCGRSGALTIVFPNRRAGVFFQKYLAEKSEDPIWSPTITSIEDFILNLSSQKLGDRLEMIFDLYKVFAELNNSEECK